MAPLSRIHATATEVSRPPEKAMPTRSPAGRDVRTLDIGRLCMTTHGHAKPPGVSPDVIQVIRAATRVQPSCGRTAAPTAAASAVSANEQTDARGDEGTTRAR